MIREREVQKTQLYLSIMTWIDWALPLTNRISLPEYIHIIENHQLCNTPQQTFRSYTHSYQKRYMLYR